MITKIRRSISKLHVLIIRAKLGLKLVAHFDEFKNQTSYYSENNRKSDKKILWELFIHVLKYGEINKFYFAYGLDQKDCHNKNEFSAYSEFMDKRNKMNCTRPFDYLCILRDKYLFNVVAEHFKIPIPTVYGIMEYDSVSKSHNVRGGSDYAYH